MQTPDKMSQEYARGSVQDRTKNDKQGSEQMRFPLVDRHPDSVIEYAEETWFRRKTFASQFVKENLLGFCVH